MAARAGPPARRPELYHPLAEPVVVPPVAGGGRLAVAVHVPGAARTAGGADGDVPAALARSVGAAVAEGADLVVLGELAGTGTASRAALAGGDPGPADRDGRAAVAAVAAALSGTAAHAVATVVEATGAGAAHVAVVVGAGGPALHQPVLHRSPRHPWQQVLGDRQKVLTLPGAGLSVLAGDDLWVPESARLAGLGGATVLVALTGDGTADHLGRALADARAAEGGMEVVVAGSDWHAFAAPPGTVPRVCPVPSTAPRPT